MIEKIEVFVASCDECSIPFPDYDEPIWEHTKEEILEAVRASDWYVKEKRGSDNPLVLCPECKPKEEEEE